MLAVWLAATNHAVFELAGVMNTEFSSAVDVGQERWHQVEDNLTKQKKGLTTKPAAAKQVLPVLELVRLAGAQAMQLARLEAPPVDAEARAFHIWHFVRRAAPLPGAPSALV